MVQKTFLLYQLLCFLYLHIVYSLARGHTALNFQKLIDSFSDEKLLLILGFFSMVSTYRMQKISKYIFLLFVFVVLGKGMQLLMGDLNKIILVLNFFLVIFSYYFYQVWSVEMESSSYNPRFHRHSINKGDLYGLEVEVIDSEGSKYSGYITNWDESGAFIVMNEGEEVPVRPREIFIKYEENNFSCKIKAVSRDGSFGIGIIFIQMEEREEIMGWKSLYNILNNRGLRPIYS